MLISLFSALVCPFGMLDAPFCIFPLGWVLCSFGFAVLVVPFAALACGWPGSSLAVRGLGCELGRLISLFSALDFPFGTLVSAFAVLVCGWAGASLAVRGLGCE